MWCKKILELHGFLKILQVDEDWCMFSWSLYIFEEYWRIFKYVGWGIYILKKLLQDAKSTSMEAIFMHLKLSRIVLIEVMKICQDVLYALWCSVCILLLTLVIRQCWVWCKHFGWIKWLAYIWGYMSNGEDEVQKWR